MVSRKGCARLPLFILFSKRGATIAQSSYTESLKTLRENLLGINNNSLRIVTGRDLTRLKTRSPSLVSEILYLLALAGISSERESGTRACFKSVSSKIP